MPPERIPKVALRKAEGKGESPKPSGKGQLRFN